MLLLDPINSFTWMSMFEFSFVALIGVVLQWGTHHIVCGLPHAPYCCGLLFFFLHIQVGANNMTHTNMCHVNAQYSHLFFLLVVCLAVVLALGNKFGEHCIVGVLHLGFKAHWIDTVRHKTLFFQLISDSVNSAETLRDVGVSCAGKWSLNSQDKRVHFKT